MVDRDKVILMTKLAREEKNHRRKNFPAVRFFGDDYVGFQILKGVIGVTLIFLLVLFCCAFYTADVWTVRYSLEELLRVGALIGILYLCVIILSVVLMFLVYYLRFLQAKERIEKQERSLKKLNRYYEEER